MLSDALGDNIFGVILPYLSQAMTEFGPQIAHRVWNWAKGTEVGRRVTDAVQRYTGYNLNDHNNGPYKPIQMPDTETTGDSGKLQIHSLNFID